MATHLHMSPAVVPHVDTVFSIVRKIYGREPTDNKEDLDVNAATWGIFLNTALQAAVHLGQDYGEFTICQESSLEVCETVFNETGILIRDQTEITGVTTIDYKEYTWRSTSLLCDRACRSRMPRPASSPTRCSVSEA